MSRSYRLFLSELLEAIRKIERYHDNYSFEQVAQEKMRLEAVLYNLIVIGEAVKGVPQEIRARHPETEWAKIVGFRNFAVHEYFDIDLDIIQNILETKLPPLKLQVELILAKEADDAEIPPP